MVARRKAAEKGTTKRPRSSREVVQFKGGTGEMKAFEEEGRVELSLRNLTPATVEEVTAALRKLLG